MDTTTYHILTREETPKIVELLTECFENDPLFLKLFPKEVLRKKLLPELFACDAEEMFHYCDMLSDGPDVNGLLILQDGTENRKASVQKNYERLYSLKTDWILLKNDLSFRALFRYVIAHKFFLSKWQEKVAADKKLHLIYFAVRRALHGTGIAHRLMFPLLKYCDKNDITITLETHNEQNLKIYNHYGFELFDTIEGNFGIAQSCLVRAPERGREISPIFLPRITE